MQKGYFDEHGKKQGVFETYDVDDIHGKYLFNRITYKDDLSDGPATEYYPDGTLRCQGNLIDDKFEGLWRTYYPDGRVQAKAGYKAGERDGLAEIYNPDGSLMGMLLYSQGVVQKNYTPELKIIQKWDIKKALWGINRRDIATLAFDQKVELGMRHPELAPYVPAKKLKI